MADKGKLENPEQAINPALLGGVGTSVRSFLRRVLGSDLYGHQLGNTSRILD
jgi:hypothetical protein